VIVGAVFVVEVPDTVMLNHGSAAEETPSDAMIITPENVPAALGVPASWPVVVLNDAHDGLFAMLKVSLLPSASEAEGVKLYAVPELTEVAGEPLIVGSAFALTVMVNDASAVEALPSLTEMTTFEYVPASAVPVSDPLAMLNVAHEGLLVMEKERVSLLASAAVGVNE